MVIGYTLLLLCFKNHNFKTESDKNFIKYFKELVVDLPYNCYNHL